MDSVRLELETDHGVSSVEGALILGRPRLIRIDGIACEAPLDGHLTFMKNQDLPGVIGYIGTVMGQHGVNIANFSLGRRDEPVRPGEPLEAIAVIESDAPVPESALKELLSDSRLKFGRTVAFDHRAGAAAK